MKIKEIKAYNLFIPHEVKCRPPWAPGRVEEGREFTFIIIRTNEGISGYGGGNGHFAKDIENKVKPYLINKSPYYIEDYIRILQNAGNLWMVEIALWDIIGKSAGLPLYKLWGAARDQVKAYASTAELKDPQERAEQALHYCEEGFKAMKFRFHCETIEEDLEILDAILDAIGDRDIDIMIDANQATLNLPSPERGPIWNYKRAYDTARELEKRDVLWLEEPLGRWDFDNLARLTKNVDILIAGGEYNKAPHEFKWLIENKCYDIIQPDIVMAGSISQVKKIKNFCEFYNIPFIPHHGLSGFGLASIIHLVCTYPDWSYIEYMYDPPYRTVETYQCLGGIITTPIRIDKKGFIKPLSDPGLGLKIDEKKINEYIVN